MLKETEMRKWAAGGLGPVSEVNFGQANPFETKPKMAA